MGCLQLILAIIFPPLAVIKNGWSTVLMVFLFTLFGWIPGVIAAIIILNRSEKKNKEIRLKNKSRTDSKLETSPILETASSFSKKTLETNVSDQNLEKDIAHYILATQKVDVNQIADQFEIKIPRALNILSSLQSQEIIYDSGKGYSVSNMSISDLDNFFVEKETAEKEILTNKAEDNDEEIAYLIKLQEQDKEDSNSDSITILEVGALLLLVVGFFLPAFDEHSFFNLAYFPWIKENDTASYYFAFLDAFAPIFASVFAFLFWLPQLSILLVDLILLMALLAGGEASFELGIGFYMINVSTFSFLLINAKDRQ